MRCGQCGSNNQPYNNFCARCGKPLATTCTKCGAESPPASNFCGKCGGPLGLVPIRTDDEPQSHVRAGERRHLTVLFCDLVDSTSMATQLDPEEWREIIADYHHAAAHAIESFDGYAGQYLGDGVMAYFGWPLAHENDAERAARAGLAILQSIARLKQKPGRAKLFARVGIHSGPVVVGTGVGGGDDVFGDVPSIASRVQAVAAPGTVLVTEDTHRLVSRVFEVEPRGRNH
jgi:class 3 adenylate cyclase